MRHVPLTSAFEGSDSGLDHEELWQPAWGVRTGMVLLSRADLDIVHNSLSFSHPRLARVLSIKGASSGWRRIYRIPCFRKEKTSGFVSMFSAFLRDSVLKSAICPFL